MLLYITLSTLLISSWCFAIESLHSLSITNNKHLAVFTFNFTEPQSSISPYLPYFFISSLRQSPNLTWLHLQMSYNHPPLELQQTHPKRGVKLLSNSPLSIQTIKLLQGTFGISSRIAEQRYHLQIHPTLHVYIDPNDFVCAQNIMDLLRVMPCEGHSGVLSLVNIRRILQEKYVAIEFVYTKQAEVVKYMVRLIVEYDNTEPFKNLMKDRLGKCEIYDQAIVFNGDKGNPVFLDRLPRMVYNQQFIKPIGQVPEAEFVSRNVRNVVGRWYGLTSKLVHQVSLKKEVSNVTVYEHFDREYVPQIDKVKVIGFKKGGYQESKQQVAISDYKIQLLNTQPSKCQAQLKNKYVVKVTISNPPVSCGIRIVIPYFKFMKGFELYEIIDKGGDQFVPAVILINTYTSQFIYFSENVIDKLPEPDFSLPFHVITFTIAIAGYFWVSLWRSYLKVLDHKYKQEEKEKKVTEQKGQVESQHPKQQ